MEKIDMEVDDFFSYCDYKGLATKTIRSYDQTLKLFLQYLKDECNIKNSNQVMESHIKNYIANVNNFKNYTRIKINKIIEICLFALFFTEMYCKILPTFF
ncbi:MAG: site-specific integrase [Clostridia bacterium]|nr:site-specific integrase [Clostridia bacterium]